MLTFLIVVKLSFSATLMVFTATRYPMYIPDLTSENPPEASISPEDSIFSVIIMESGSRPWDPASLLNVTKNEFNSFLFSLRCAMP